MNNLSQIQFMPASEVKKNFTNPDRAVGEYTQKQSYRSKLQESKDSGLYESIKKEGIKNPIVLQQRKNRLISKIFKPQSLMVLTDWSPCMILTQMHRFQ